MAANDDGVIVKFGVRLNELFSGLASAQSAVKSSTGEMKESVEGLGKIFEGLQSKLIGFSVILGGGALFKEGVSASKEMTGEALKLAKALGITTEEGSYLNVALKSVGLSADAYAGANQRLTRMLKTNESGLNAMGVATRDSSGELLNGQKVMTNAVAALGQYKEGTDRNLAAQALFGRGAAEATAILKLNSEAMEKARVTADALGLTVGTRQADEMKAYKEAMEQVALVMDGIQNTIGKALMPVLTELAEMFAESGPARVKIMSVVMQGLADVFRLVIDSAMTLKDAVVEVFTMIGDAIGSGTGEGITAMQFLANVFNVVKLAVLALKLVFVVTFEAIVGAVQNCVAHFQLFAAVTKAALTPGASIADAWRAGMANIEAVVDASAARIAGKAKEIAAQMQRAAMGESPIEQKAPEHKTGKKGSKSYSGEDKAGSASQAPSEIAAFEAQNKAQKDAYELAHGLQQRSLQDDVAFWQSAVAIANRSNGDIEKAREKLQQAKISAMRQDLAQGKASSEEAVNFAEKEATTQIELSKLVAENDLALGKITQAQFIQIEKDTEAQKLAVMQSAQQSRINLLAQDPTVTPAALQKEKDKLLEIEQAYAVKVAAIDNKQNLESQKFNLQVSQNIEKGLNTTLKGLMTGQLKLRDAWKGTLKDIGNTLSSTVAKMATDWIMGQLKMRAASKVTALEQLNAAAMAAAGNAYNAIVGIPYVGPFLAPVAAVTAYAGVMAFASAEGGYDIPAGVNPMTQLHQKEMVLPAEHADTIRSLKGGGGGGDTNHFHIQAMDGASVHRVLMANPAAFAAAAKNSSRKGHSF
jgi:hypothetical protein